MSAWVECKLPESVWEERRKEELKSKLTTPPLKVRTLILAQIFKNHAVLKAGTGRPLHCKQNVEQFLQENPTASRVVGQIVWWHPKKKHAATEDHEVVRLADGTLKDVTSYFSQEKEILFIY